MTTRDDGAEAGPFTATPGGVEWRHERFRISTDPELIDFPLTTAVLEATYWATGIPEHVVRQSVEGSLAFGMYEVATGAAAADAARDGAGAGDAAAGGLTQIGFARVVTDRAVFAWVGDVFVVESHRGRGLGLWLMRCVKAHPELQGLRRWMLASTTARGLYTKIGFSQLDKPELFMEIYDPEIHRRQG